MSVEPKYFNNIKTPRDNNCLFRSMVIFLNNSLLKCRRNKNGYPVNKQLSEYEDNCTRFLRETVVRMINSRREKYSSKEFYDRELYTSIEDRIEKMSKDGVFGGKLEMDIISKMYKIKISVFIKFNGEYSSIYRSTLEEDETEKTLKTVADTDLTDYNYSDGDICFLLLDEDNYQLLEPDYIKIKSDFTEPVIEKVISESNIFNCKNKIIDDNDDSFEENVMLTITDKRMNVCGNSSSNLSDSSFLNSSNNSFYNDEEYEKIEINREISPSQSLGNDLLINRFRDFVYNNKSGILIKNRSQKNVLIEIKENYKNLSFNDLTDLINSLE